MSTDFRHRQLVQIICDCVADASDVGETLMACCAMRVPAATCDDMRKALEHVGCFDMREVERALPTWERYKNTPEFEERRRRFARAIKGLDKA
jgi:hypothetical protein